jgi:PAS domain S-box-containing protein
MTTAPLPHPWSDPETPLAAIASHRIAHLGPENTLLEAVRLLADGRISSLLVLDADQQPLGILTEEGLLRALHNATPPQTGLREVMEPPVVVPTTISCMEAYQHCLREGARHLILVDAAQRAMAVASESDFHRHLDVDVLTGQAWVSSIMSRSPCTAAPETTLETALEQMHSRTMEAIVVVEHQRPIGILSRRDLPRLYLAISTGEGAGSTLRQVMTAPVHTLPMDTPLTGAAHHMLSRGIRQQPVVDDSGRLVGMLTSQALTQALAFGKPDVALRQEKAHFRELLEQAPFPLMITRVDDGRVCYLNPWAELQFHHRQEKILGKSVAPFYAHPEERDRLLAMLHRDGSVHDLELSFIDSAGKPFQALISSSLVEYEHQPAILTAFNDITKRKQDEQELLFRNILLATQQEAAIDGILVVDGQNRILSLNRRYAQMWQVPDHLVRQPKGREILEVVSSRVADPATFSQTVRTLYKQRDRTSRQSVRLADGRIFDWYTTPMFDDDQCYLGRICFFRDITEEHRAKQQLEHERAKLRGLFQAIPDLLWVKDPEGMYLLCNPVFERFFGAKEADIVGRTDYDFVSKDLADFFRTHDRRAMAAGGPVVNEEWLEFADGSRKGLFETLKTPLRDESGGLIGILGIARDITQRRREQRDLRERVKEQQCLYHIFALTEDMHAPFGEQLQRVVEQIPLGWHNPETTEARITFTGETHATPDFEKSAWMQTEEATTDQGEPVRLTVAYRELRPRLDEEPFSPEKRELAKAVVQRLAEVADRRHTLEAVSARDQLIACMFAQTTDAIVLVDVASQRFVEFNTIAHTGLGYTREEFARLRVADFQAELSPAQILAEHHRVLEGGRLSLETQHRHKNGAILDVAVTLRPLSLYGKQLISAVWQDITERKARQRELEESRTRLKAITDSALDAIVMMDHQGNVSYWNPAAEQMLGYRGDEALGQNLHQLCVPARYHTDHQAAFMDFIKNGKGKVVGKTIELSALHRDGHEIPVSLSLSSVLLQDQWHAIGILRDISRQKQHQAELEAALGAAESANQAKSEILAHLEELVKARTRELDVVNDRLRISEERYALALEASSDGLWDWDMVTDTLYRSPAYCRMLGYEPEELPPHAVSMSVELVHPEDRDLVSTAIEQHLIGQGHLELEFRMLTKDGGVVWVLSRSKVVARDDQGRPIRAVGIHTDLTARKRIETELRTAAEEQQAIFNAASMGIALITNRVIIRCNRKLEEVFGYAPGEFAGKTTEVWYQSRAEFLRRGHEIGKALQTSGFFHAEILMRRRDGSLFWARTTAQALDRSDLSKGLVWILEDITQERRVLENLRQAKEDAEAATRAKTEFLANMSHEIRTPLNAILGFTHLIRREPLSPRQANQLDKLSDASHHLLKIINDVLDLSKIEANRMDLDRNDFSPALVIDQVCAIVGSKREAQKLRLHTDIGQIPDLLWGDGSRLGQILLNLVDNAVKFTEQGQIDISARVVEQSPEKIVLRFAIQDTGIGMSEDQIARIFQAFEQADTSTTRRFGGTGLGLAISKQLVLLMGGRIGVESRLGQGTLFWVDIPFAPSTPAVSRQDETTPACAMRRSKPSAQQRPRARNTGNSRNSGFRGGAGPGSCWWRITSSTRRWRTCCSMPWAWRGGWPTMARRRWPWCGRSRLIWCSWISRCR